MTDKTDTKHLRIQIREKYQGFLKTRGVNYSAFTVAPYVFKPTSFTSDIPGLKPKAISAQTQRTWMSEFLADPFKPRNICISSAPNDGKAKLLAAYMMQYLVAHHTVMQQFPLWHDITGGYSNPLIKDKAECSLLVINNVGLDSTPVKLEKCRDLLTTYADIPRITVCHGTDPFRFMTLQLGMASQACYYLTNTLVSRTVIL